MPPGSDAGQVRKTRVSFAPAFNPPKVCISMIIKALRVGLGQLIIFLDWISRPAKLKRSPEAQAEVEKNAANLALYQFHACPFCVKTRRTLHKLNVPVTLRDAKNDPQARRDLEKQGGKIKVPCLRIEENGQSTWLYESKEIIAYLNERFATA
jgi:glutaredoxin